MGNAAVLVVIDHPDDGLKRVAGPVRDPLAADQHTAGCRAIGRYEERLADGQRLGLRPPRLVGERQLPSLVSSVCCIHQGPVAPCPAARSGGCPARAGVPATAAARMTDIVI
ncbi:MAG: hypothetical protein A2W31_04250 [Planctomycetes bacterium RBG_16_64_10]|nr:MAG: hypothetical protein A2W31_04250 [Planctomycetes bacterium RBG_16_64_10]